MKLTRISPSAWIAPRRERIPVVSDAVVEHRRRGRIYDRHQSDEQCEFCSALEHSAVPVPLVSVTTEETLTWTTSYSASRSYRSTTRALTTGGSADFGQFNVGRYARFTGLVSTVGSLTLRLRTGVASGFYQVSSNFAVNSGVLVMDCLNFGRFGYFDITAAQSTVYSLVINGEPLR